MTDQTKDLASAPSPDERAGAVDHTTRWVFIRRDKRTFEEIRRVHHDEIRRTWEPLGNSLGDRIKRLRRELHLWWH